MTVWHLIIREIYYRKLTFGLGVLAILVAVGCLIGALSFLGQHDRKTEEIVAAKQADTTQRMERLQAEIDADMKKLEDDYRKITVKMGFNLLILPKHQELPQLIAGDPAPQYMPEDYATKLADAKVATVNHLLPVLQQRADWPEHKLQIILVGVKGEVYVQSAKQKAIQEAVPAGKMVVGDWIGRALHLKAGQEVKLKGRAFTVHKVQPPSGERDDITVWINLREAQELLDRRGKISAIFALECGCEPNRLAVIRQEVESILPDTKSIELTTKVIARAEARNRAAAEARARRAWAATKAREEVEQEQQSRDRLRHVKETLAAVLVPVAMVGCGGLIALLTLISVRQRRGEIGILRALGLRSWQILSIFLGKAAVMGLLGALLGYGVGTFAGVLGPDSPDGAALVRMLFDPKLFLLALLAAPLLAVVATWIPALLAALQDPAVALREE